MQTTAIAVSTVAAKQPATKRSSRVRRTRLTYEDYAAITPANNGNYELINGNLIFIPSPTPEHQDVVTELDYVIACFRQIQQPRKGLYCPARHHV
jgi:Uma2 family endonuclease